MTMCKHNKRYTLHETAETALTWCFEDGQKINTQTPGIISKMIDFECQECGHKKRFNRYKAKENYLKTALALFGI